MGIHGWKASAPPFSKILVGTGAISPPFSATFQNFYKKSEKILHLSLVNCQKIEYNKA
jgi:hypothetical protein